MKATTIQEADRLLKEGDVSTAFELYRKGTSGLMQGSKA